MANETLRLIGGGQSESVDQELNLRELWRALLRRKLVLLGTCLLYTSPSPRDGLLSRMPSSA